MANNTEGRFIPYIGALYNDGICVDDSHLKILVIGPRHYCDAIYNSRNVLVDLSDTPKAYSKLRTGEPFPREFIVGCVKVKSDKCLKNEADTGFIDDGRKWCPVFKNKSCPIKRNCALKNKLKISCNGKRILRCETLYAVSEFIGKPKFESARLGMSYFGRITQFLNKQFRLSMSSRDVWERIAFFNLIQRYIPLQNINFDSEKIREKIKKEDIMAGERIISELTPDLILTTMTCVSKSMTKIFVKHGYVKNIHHEGYDYDVYYKDSLKIDVIKPEWQECLDSLVRDYLFPDMSYKLREEILGIVQYTLNTYGAEIHGRSAENEVRKYVRRAFVEKIKNAANISTSIRNIKCFNECCENPDDAMRQWLRYKSEN